jgi:hypothetical protein
MYSAGPQNQSWASHDWYSLHFMESNQKALVYLTQVREWLDAHPQELVVFWLSRHGSTCETEYPDVLEQAKLEFWGQIEQLFDGLLFDRSQSQLNLTTIDELIQTNQRMIIFLSDEKNFTQGSPFSSSGCTIDNLLGDDADNETFSLPALIGQFALAGTRKAHDKALNQFFLMTMAAGAPSSQIESAAILTYDPLSGDLIRKKCARAFNIPGLTDWCPMTLQDISQLTNYYNQIALEAVITQNLDFPNAIYIDAVDESGLIRTGTQLFGVQPNIEETTGYCYADTIIYYNILSACKEKNTLDCIKLKKQVAARRQQNPLTLWNDPETGRLVDWPTNISFAFGFVS